MKLSHHALETHAIAAELFAQLELSKIHRPALASKCVVLDLRGELGSGKTTFAQGFIAAWYAARVGLGASAEANPLAQSPTFSIVREYSVQGPERQHCLAHYDLYRIEDPSALDELALEHYLNSAEYCLIEWFEKFESELKSSIHTLPYVKVELTPHSEKPEQRSIMIELKLK